MPEPAKRIESGDGDWLACLNDLDTASICYWWDKEHHRWYLYLPHCGLGDLSMHQVVEHEDGTITVQPSIKVTGHRGIIRHGYLERGVWRECE